jgi:hypothetical protein
MSFVLNKKFVNLRNFDIIILFSFDFKPFNNLKKLKTFLIMRNERRDWMMMPEKRLNGAQTTLTIYFLM